MWLSRHLQREQRVREPLRPEDRARLLPEVADDVALLAEVTGESFDDWLAQSTGPRSAGKFGTAFTSIDDPFGQRSRRRPTGL